MATGLIRTRIRLDRSAARRRRQRHRPGFRLSASTAHRQAAAVEVSLTAEDRAILALEDARLVGHTATVVHLPAGAPDLRQLRDARSEEHTSALQSRQY